MSTRAEVVKEGAKVSRIIMWLLYICVKPETSIKLMAFPCHCKAQIFPVFPVFPMGTLGSPITIGQC